MAINSGEINTCNWIYFGMAMVSLSCSVLTLYLIYYMKIRNGYLLLISSMTACQVIYDINFIQGVIPGYVNCVIWNVFNILGGLSVSIWSNIISYVALYVIVEIRSMNIYEKYKYFFAIAIIPPLFLSLISIAVIKRPDSNDDDQPYLYCVYNDTLLARGVYAAYYWGRIITILFNFGVFAYIAYRIYRMMKLVKNEELLRAMATKSERELTRTANTRNNDNGNRLSSQASISHNIGIYPITAATQCMAIITLVSRMKWYPLAQAISRSGAAWNEFDNYRFDTYESNAMAAVCSPLSGILNFVIFLVMQPKAWNTLTGLFCDNPHDDSSVSNSNSPSTIMPNAVHEAFVTATSRVLSSSTNPADLMDNFDEDELHTVINDLFMQSHSGHSSGVIGQAIAL